MPTRSCRIYNIPADIALRRFIAGFVFLLRVTFPLAVWAQSYTVTTINFPGSASPPSIGTEVFGFNNNGQIIGAYQIPSQGFSGFLYSAGKYSTISGPGGLAVAPMAINDNGQMVGIYSDAGTGNIHGFMLSGGSFTSFDLPVPNLDFMSWSPRGINNAGQIVGYYLTTGDYRAHAFLLDNGVFTTIDPPGAVTADAYAINNSGEIVGTYSSSLSSAGGSFLLKGGTYSTISVTFAGTIATNATGINDLGDIVGFYCFGSNNICSGQFLPFLFSNGTFNMLPVPSGGAILLSINNTQQVVGDSTYSGFLGDPIGLSQMVDPVPSLIDGAQVTQNAQLLATGGQVVQGVAADGVAEVVVRITGTTVGERFSMTLLNDGTPPAQSSSADDDGALGNPGDTTFSQSSVTVMAQNTNAGPMAFAIYRAPVDFVRPLNTNDAGASQRSVSIRISDASTGVTSAIPLTILRPPVFLIHGIWDTSSLWNNFSPLYSSGASDSRFDLWPVDYSGPVHLLLSVPEFASKRLASARANALGFDYNASKVLTTIQSQISAFKNGSNHAGIQVASVQADIVAHSMGGNVTRYFALQRGFYSGDTLGKGNVHKVITIDTPHLGTPLASQLLQDTNKCVRNKLADNGEIAFDSVTFLDDSYGASATGAAGDFQGDGIVGGFLSPALTALKTTSKIPLPTALISGAMKQSNLDNVDVDFVGIYPTNAYLLRLYCGKYYGNPLAKALTSTTWPSVFILGSNDPGNSDAIVPLSSQLNGLLTAPVPTFTGYVHSDGTKLLGFGGPAITDDPTDPTNALPNKVIDLLNTPVTDSVFVGLNP